MTYSAELLKLELTSYSERNYLHAAKKALNKILNGTEGLNRIEIADMSKPETDGRKELYRVRINCSFSPNGK